MTTSTWLDGRAAAAHLGISMSQVRRRAAAGLLQRKAIAHGVYHYLVEGDPDDAPAAPAPAAPEADPLAGLTAPSEADSTRRYFYNDATDVYVFALRDKPHPFAVEGDTVRAVVTLYSNAVDKAATVNQVARKFAWRRQTVQGVLRALGKTHDSLPFTDETLRSTGEDQLVESIDKLREEKVGARVERERWEKLKDLGVKAENWDRFVLERLRGLVHDEAVYAPPRPPRYRSPRTNDLTIITYPTDLHFGKFGAAETVGEDFDREVCRERLMDTMSTMMSRCGNNGRLTKIITASGGDWLNCDNRRGTTTRGTPQDNDGTYTRIYLGGAALLRDEVNLLRGYAPVDVRCVLGNHDEQSGLAMHHWLAAVYEGAEDVAVCDDYRARQYVTAGRVLVGLTHGDGPKQRDLPTIMAVEQPEAWGNSTERIWMSGHLHHKITEEHYGVLCMTLPSLAGNDDYHYGQGYVGSRKGLMAVMIDHAEGYVGQIVVSV